MKKLLIIDTYAFLYRAYYASKDTLKNTKGENIGAYNGFFSTFLYLIKETNPTHVIFASDSSSPSLRKQKYPEYKANRDHMPDDLRSQIQSVRNALSEAKIDTQKEDGLEADDIIVAYAEAGAVEGFDSIIIASGDKDILQVVSDEKHITLLRPPSFGSVWTMYDEAKILEKYGIPKKSMASYLSLLGDKSDNVPGVNGIGEKTARDLLLEYETIEGVYKNLDKITKPKLLSNLEEGRDNAFFSYELIKLEEGSYKTKNLDEFEIKNIDFTNLIITLEKDGLKAVSSRLQKFLKENNILTEAVKVDIPTFQGEFKEGSLAEFCSLLKAKESIAVYYERSEKLSYALDGKRASYIKGGECSSQKIRDALKSFLLDKNKRLIGYDLKALFKDLDLEEEIQAELLDLNIMSYLLDSETQYFSIPYLCEKYLSLTFEEVKKKKRETLFDEDEEEDKTLLYPCVLNLVSEAVYQDLVKENLVDYYKNIETKIIPILAKMEKNGIYLDRKELISLKDVLSLRLSKLEEEIYTLAGKTFNISSPQQLGEVLFDELGLSKGKKTKTGYSVDAEVLENLALSSPIAEKILQYRGASKLKSTYTDALINLIDPSNNRLHTTFLQTGTATGRFSSVHPNLQNIPIRDEEGRLVRKAFKSTEGNVLLSSDYSQIELVVLSHFSEDKNLLSFFKSGEDVHKLTASLVFKKNVDEITASERRAAKTINFGVIYGMSAFRLSNDLGISRQEANKFLEDYFETFSGVKDFIERTIEEVRKTSFTTTLLGHKRYFKTILDSNRNIRLQTERAAVNSIIQGSAADILKKAMIDLDKALRNEKRIRLLLNVHDELIFEVEESYAKQAQKIIEEVMMNAVSLKSPLRVSSEISTSWGEMH